MHFDGCVLSRWRFLAVTHASDLDIASEANAELTSITAGAAPGLLRAQLAVIGRFQRPVQSGDVIPGVIQRAELSPVRLGESRQQVLAADFGRVHTRLGREQVYRPL